MGCPEHFFPPLKGLFGAPTGALQAGRQVGAETEEARQVVGGGEGVGVVGAEVGLVGGEGGVDGPVGWGGVGGLCIGVIG